VNAGFVSVACEPIAAFTLNAAVTHLLHEAGEINLRLRAAGDPCLRQPVKVFCLAREIAVGVGVQWVRCGQLRRRPGP
jgi:hypothetical protein